MHQPVDPWQAPFTLLTIDQVLALPPAEWLIDGVMEIGSFSSLYGSPGGGKSFVALDMALSIATGRTWQGRRVNPGGVVYIVGEGGSGIAKRIKAWLQHHEVSKIECALFSLRPVQITDTTPRDLLVEKIKTAVGLEKPRLIILDTLATCFVGRNEDHSHEMGQFVDAARIVREATGAAVSIVHHSIKSDGATERGSTALRGAVDMMLHVHRRPETKPPTGPIFLTMTKQKDHETADEMIVDLRQVQIGTDEHGQTVTSCVIVPSDKAAAGAKRHKVLTRVLLGTLRALSNCPGRLASAGEWERSSGRTSTSFNRDRKRLASDGYVEHVGREYRPTARGLAVLGIVLDATSSILSPGSFSEGDSEDARTTTTATPLM